MAFKAKVLADSIANGVRLTTLEVSYPRIIHGEMLRHRMLSRCAASSRAIPVERFIEQVMTEPYVPEHWGKNQKGMVAGDELNWVDKNHTRDVWLKARDSAVTHAQQLLSIGLHKQLTNRLLEPFQWITEVISGTEWSNFFHLRIHPDAHPDIQKTAFLMKEAMDVSQPRHVGVNQWHTPLASLEEADQILNAQIRDASMPDLMQKVSAGRVARVSYLRHSDESDWVADVKRAETMIKHGHMSPLEHVARPLSHNDEDKLVSSNLPLNEVFVGNFRGWVQYRKLIKNEHDFLGQ
jgi:thymidylate synthase ThyX